MKFVLCTPDRNNSLGEKDYFAGDGKVTRKKKEAKRYDSFVDAGKDIEAHLTALAAATTARGYSWNLDIQIRIVPVYDDVSPRLYADD